MTNDEVGAENEFIEVQVEGKGNYGSQSGFITAINKANLGQSAGSSQSYRIKGLGLKNDPVYVFVQSRRDEGPNNFPDNYAVHVMGINREELLIRVTRVDQPDGWGWDLWVNFAIYITG